MLLLSAFAAAEETVDHYKAVQEKLMCQCGCNMVLYVCNHSGCPSALPMRDTIRTMQEQDVPDQEIVDHFVKSYGTIVLSAPPKEGFFLVGWFLPIVILLAAVLLISFAVRKWLAAPKLDDATFAADGTPNTPPPDDPNDLVEKELNKLK